MHKKILLVCLICFSTLSGYIDIFRMREWSFIIYIDLFQAQSNLHESGQKIDLLRLALETKLLEIQADARKSKELRQELELTSPHNSMRPFDVASQRLSTTSLSKCAAVTGKLEVRKIILTTIIGLLYLTKKQIF